MYTDSKSRERCDEVVGIPPPSEIDRLGQVGLHPHDRELSELVA